MKTPTDAPLISVITPLYNASQTLDASVKSVLEQTHRNIELILIDDGSTDGSGAMCDGYAAQDARVRVIHQPNRGVSAARNAGLQAARGDYIAWLDSDDRYAPNMLETLLSALTGGEAGIAVCNYWNIDGDKRVLRYPNIHHDRVYAREEYMGYVLTKTASAVLWCTLMPRRLYEGVAFPEGKTFEDIRVTYRLYEQAERIALVAEPLIFRIHHDDSLSRVQNLGLRIDNMYGYIERYEDAVQRWPQYRRAMLVSMSRMLTVLRGYSLRATKTDFAAHRREILDITRFYRAHRREILSSCKSLPRRLVYAFEFDCMTSASQPILALSQRFDNLIRRPVSCLRRIPIPDLPPFES